MVLLWSSTIQLFSHLAIKQFHLKVSFSLVRPKRLLLLRLLEKQNVEWLHSNMDMYACFNDITLTFMTCALIEFFCLPIASNCFQLNNRCSWRCPFSIYHRNDSNIFDLSLADGFFHFPILFMSFEIPLFQ